MAAMTRRWASERCWRCAVRKASPWRRKMAATSSAGRKLVGLSGRDHREREAVEWARRAADQVGGDLRVTRSRGQIDVPEQDLNDADIGPALQKMRGEAVPQRVSRDGLTDPRPLPCHPTGELQSPGAHVLARLLARKQPQAGPSPMPVGAQNV